MIIELKNKIFGGYKPTLTEGKIYKDISLYYEYKFKGEVLVLSLNSVDKRIYIYHRSKKVVNYLSSILNNKGFSENTHLFYIDIAMFVISDLVSLMVELLKDIEMELLEQNKQGLDCFVISNDRVEKELRGNFRDNDNNEVSAPLNLYNCKIQFMGKDNKVKIHPDAGLKNVVIQCVGDGAEVTIGEAVTMFGYWRLGFNCKIKIGHNVTSTSSVYMTCAEETSIEIGNDCMFATNNQIRTDDAHAIYNIDTGERVNLSESIIIGDHVWLAYGAMVLGGADIGSGSIVGASTLVKNKFPENCTLVGTPAKIIKEGVSWERAHVLHFPKPRLQQE